MTQRTPLVRDFARAIYDIEPVCVGGFEASFDDAPVSIRRACYDRARAAVNTLRGDR